MIKGTFKEMEINELRDDVIKWIRGWFAENGPDCNAIIGISGGKDSTVVAALCVEALGVDRVIGVKMPNGTQHDIDVANEVIDFLGIKSIEINIEKAFNSILAGIDTPSEQTRINLPARLRMATLYAVAQSHNGRVANTCNLSEEWVGYSTRWGDNVGDFAPIAQFLVCTVKELGYSLGLPAKFIEKIPEDGLTGLSDEDNIGISYEEIDKYIINDCLPKNERIEALNDASRFKRESVSIPTYYSFIYFDNDSDFFKI